LNIRIKKFLTHNFFAMKKFYLIPLFCASLLLSGCFEATDKPTMVNNNPIYEPTENVEVAPSLLAEKTSKYSWSRKMEKPELTEMDNFNEMLN
jgi:hypothetical protein